MYNTIRVYINKTETRQKQETKNAWYRMIMFCNLLPYKILVLVLALGYYVLPSFINKGFIIIIIIIIRQALVNQLAVVMGLLWLLGCTLVAVVIVERMPLWRGIHM